MNPISFEMPLKTSNPLNNSHGHWRKVAKKRKTERYTTALAFREAVWKQKVRMGDGLRFTVNLTRVAPSNGLDADSLPAALKSVRDELALHLGFTNDNDPRLRWEYGQARGKPKEYAVRVRIEVVE
jgi:hypothetical protein